jgi:hypothetical protein
VVLEVFHVDQLPAEVTYVDVVYPYDVDGEAPLDGVVVRRAYACKGVGNVLIHASGYSGPKVIPLSLGISSHCAKMCRLLQRSDRTDIYRDCTLVQDHTADKSDMKDW